ncbi:MAG: tRNA (N6-threonylcarbamoyladenosine(37)-N6)-methyltransferase TrmO [Methanoregulaceae archaeon]|jgi:tRNA-Thr(GGU) m(6)t(6)A37 methyltransferase TsaA|nr:tRNA (N6-threonylcarbamoyladenosine(37)-N6)-methyltransferase TrmO [Methanoregulaceae archaeon]
MRESIVFQPIGIIHTPFLDPAGMPIQPAGGREITGTLEIFPEFADGLMDIEGFSRIILIYHFHRSGMCRLHLVPFLDTQPHGVFSTRAPNRPNPIGISIVSLIGRDGPCLQISGVDMLDGTPLLDIKPYLPECDAFCSERTGWFPSKESCFSTTLSDDRFSGKKND